MLTNMDKLYESVAANGPVCVGLDTEISYLPTTDTAKTAGENVVTFNRALSTPPRASQAATRCRSPTMSPWVWTACALTPKP